MAGWAIYMAETVALHRPRAVTNGKSLAGVAILVLRQYFHHPASSTTGGAALRRRQFVNMLGASALASQLSPARTTSEGHELTGVHAVASRHSRHYETWRQSVIWQRRKSARYPDVIVQAETAQEVAAAVSHAHKHGLRVTTRCGGHSASASFLRNGGMLIDVSRLNSLVVDAPRREVMAGPGVIARELNAQLAQYDLAFPTAHCGMVPLGGFLLGGGLGLNGNAWGTMSVFNILAAEVVTADGSIRTASLEENSDLFWAVRGGGPGLFGVVTKLHLKVYPLPRAIVGNTLTFPFADLEAVMSALAEIGPRIDRDVEVLGYVGPASEELAAKCKDPGCRLAVSLDGNAYTDNVATAQRKLKPLTEHPIARRAVASELEHTTTIESLYFEEELGFSQRRWVADNVFTNRPREVAAILHERMPACPAADSEAVFLYKGSPKMPDAACSTTGDFYAAYYVIWDDPTQDEVMLGYLRKLYEEIVPLGVGSNINEMDQEGRPRGIASCYTAAAWGKLQTLRKQWDPHGVFHDFYGIT
jgi:FAD/FMN-containing dehydrogenase